MLMKGNGFTVLLACLLTLAEWGHAHAGVVWWSGQHSLSRLESATEQIQTLAASSRVRAIAPLADGGAWVVHDDALERFDAALRSTRVVVVKQETPDAPTYAAVAGDSGVWIAQGKAIDRFDAMGTLVTQWRHPTTILALAVGGPEGVLIADATGVYQYRDGGLSTRVIDLRGVGAPAAMLVDLAAGYLWVATSSFGIQFDGFAGFQERSRVATAWTCCAPRDWHRSTRNRCTASPTSSAAASR